MDPCCGPPYRRYVIFVVWWGGGRSDSENNLAGSRTDVGIGTARHKPNTAEFKLKL